MGVSRIKSCLNADGENMKQSVTVISLNVEDLDVLPLQALEETCVLDVSLLKGSPSSARFWRL